MQLQAGARLQQYEILSKIGEGGMGEVYRARDTKLDRDVAIKVLPEAFATDPDRVARFEREAKTLAALNHPNIAHVYDAGTSGSSAYLVMELVDGEDLSTLINRGSPEAESGLSPDDALPIARQIAEAVEAAHERGVVHRDLKPANVKLTRDGHVKVLDFGLAKAMTADGDESGRALANSPTLTARATEAGVILGTAAYMSPEQARGKTVDKRTDIWAFGAVLYEMLTGRRAFEGETVSDTLAAVLRSEPEWTKLPAGTPPHVVALIRRCLERDQSRRLRDIGEARLALETGQAPATSTMIRAGVPQAAPVAAPPGKPWVWIGTTVLFAALAAVAAVKIWQVPPRPIAPAFELAIPAPRDTKFETGGNAGNIILSPDGSKIAFAAPTSKAQQLWVRSLAEDDAKPLAGTEGVSYPFWSTDGRKIGFFADGKLKTIEIAGGLPEVIADAPTGRGGSWSEDDTIIFTPQGGGTIHRIPAKGGAATPLTKLDLARGENAHYWPAFLPGGAQFVYFVRSTKPENGGVYLAWLDGSRPAVKLVSSLSAGIPAIRPSTRELYLIWARERDLLAQPLDPAGATLRGEAVAIGHDVRVEESQRLPFVGASRTGTLAWASARAAEVQLAVYSRDGRRIRALNIPPGEVFQQMLSPDDKRLLYARVERGNADIFLYDMGTNVLQQLTSSPDYDETPVWTLDGRAFTYVGNQAGERRILRQVVADAAAPSVLFTGPLTGAQQVSRDGRFLLLTVPNGKGGADILAQPIGGTSPAPIALATRPGSVSLQSMTQDGRWILISEGTTGSIVRFHSEGGTPSLGARIALPEGLPVHLRADGREAFIVTTDHLLRAVALSLGDETGSLGAVTPLFKIDMASFGTAVNSTGTQFIVIELPFEVGQTIAVLTNWETRLK